MPRPARTRVALALTAVAVLALAGCSGEDTADEAGPTAPASDQAVAQGLTLSGQWPLTGLPVDGAAPRHPAMVVKIDNSASSAPQVGLSGADLVTEELVEGGSTRLAVFYYSQVPALVGPVRSMRASDLGIVGPAHAVLVASGGARLTEKRIAAADITTFTEGAPGYTRDSARTVPYNLMMKLPVLADTLKRGTPPPDYFDWGATEDFPRGRPARSMAAVFSGAHTTSWTWTKKGYLNDDGFAADGDRFTPDTVLMLRVQVGDAGYLDPAGNPVPETRFTGTGDAAIFRGGRVVRGTWEKDGLESAVVLRTQAGELRLPPGKVWLELVPADEGDVVVG